MRRNIRRSLTTDAAHSLVRVDYCNRLLAAGPKYPLEKLQSVLRAAARLVLQLPYRASVSDIMRRQLHWVEMTPILRELHWFPIRQRILYKMAVLAFHCIYQSAPTYLSEMFTSTADVPGRCHLRSAHRGEVVVPRTFTKRYGPRSFRSAGPTVWNSLPCELRDKKITL